MRVDVLEHPFDPFEGCVPQASQAVRRSNRTVVPNRRYTNQQLESETPAEEDQNDGMNESN